MFKDYLKFLHLAAPVLLGLFLYFPSISYDFAYDDILQIEYNSAVTSTVGIREIFTSPTPPGNLYRPLATLTYKINYLFSALDPSAYHCFNIILYLILIFLFYHFIAPIIKSPALILASTLIFAAHPIHIEVVANIVGRAELLAAIGLLAAALLSGKAYRKKSLTLHFISATFFFLATLSKESAFSLLPLIPLYGVFTQEKRSSLRCRSGLHPLLLLAVLSLVLRYIALGDQFLIKSSGTQVYSENPIFHLPFHFRLLPALKILGDYTILLILPLKQSADYSSMPGQFLAAVYSWTGALSIFIFFLLLFSIWSARKNEEFFFGIWFLAAFALTSNILTPIGTVMGERLALTPSIGFIPFFITAVSRYIPRPRAVFISYILLLIFLTNLRLPIWRNNEALFAQTVIDAPESPKAIFNYGSYLYDHTEKHDLAEVYLRRTLELDPDHLAAARLMADISLLRKEYGRLEYWYRRILTIDPNNTKVKEELSKLLKYKQSLVQ